MTGGDTGEAGLMLAFQGSSPFIRAIQGSKRPIVVTRHRIDMLSNVPLFVPGGLGPLEMGIIFLIVIVLFGANKLPKLARSSGQAIGEFQKGRQQIEEELNEMQQEGGDVTNVDSTTADSTASEPTTGATDETTEE
jgi:sec-independent protein translocase protein TatA